jgi:hypothetical protein
MEIRLELSPLSDNLYCSIQSRLQKSENLNTITNIHIQPEAMQPIEFDKMVFQILN